MSLRNIVILFLLQSFCVDVRSTSTAAGPRLAKSPFVVGDTASATALGAEVADCAGGVVQAEWRGDVVVNQTIYISAGTCLNVTGVGPDAAMTGDGDEPVFEVENACLIVSNMRFSGGTIDGPWINASWSKITFENTSFVGAGWPGAQASVDWDGGALHVEDSTVSWRGETSFSNNTFCDNADADTMVLPGGRAIHAKNSTLRWEGKTWFYNNTLVRSAIYAIDSTLIWEGGASFSDTAVPTAPTNASFPLLGCGVILAWNSVLKWEGETSFSNNTLIGSAICAIDSMLIWEGETSFSDTAAPTAPTNASSPLLCGGVILAWNSVLMWERETSFSNNTLMRYAICAIDSTLIWEGETSFSDTTVLTKPTNASSWFDAGGVLLARNSVLKWEGETSFSNNMATYGGFIEAKNSTLAWETTASFFNNSHALTLTLSTALWRGKTLFSGNAGDYGGALCLHASTASWLGDATFSNNAAAYAGGAVYLGFGSNASWEAEASFFNNNANAAGAVAVLSSSRASWEAEATFSNNTADGWVTEAGLYYSYDAGDGGAVHVSSGSVFWLATTSFSNNYAAGRGGALSFAGGDATFNATVLFLGNSAERFGGAFSINSRHWRDDDFPSSLVMTNTTEFIDNKCRTGGGGLSMDGLVSVQFAENQTFFSDNTADVVGGGVHVANVGKGPQFTGVQFNSNSAEFGGGIYVTDSGTDHDATKFAEGSNPEERTKFDRCQFVNNIALSGGGAVNSIFGQDYFVSSTFQGNTARFGGALSLSGIDSSVFNCTFVDNSSEEDEGPAVSNRGLISSFSNSSFFTNTFVCANGKFRETRRGDYNTAFDVACEACDTLCRSCTYDYEVPSCSEQLDHTMSTGGNTTLATLKIDRGYWRSSPNSMTVLGCYNEDACIGGISGEDGFCDDGYEGPYCSVCSDGYTPTLEYVCNECSDSDGRWALVIIIIVLSLVAFMLFLSYMVSGEWDGATQGIAARIAPYIPLQSLKIVIVAWQILTQFSEVANVTYPGVYQTFLDGVKALNFDLSRILSAGCFVDVDFHERLLASTLAPLVGMAILGVTYAVATRRNRSSEHALSNVRQKHLSMVLLLTFVVYSSVSSTLFQTFGSDRVDQRIIYLRADYRIHFNDPKHGLFKVYAGVMVVLYTVGIPLFYATLLTKNREALVKVSRESNPRLKSTTDLWKPYKPHRFYYELVECGRRILLAGVVVFIYPNTAAQVAVTILIAVFFMFVSEILAPYSSAWDTWISRMGHGIVFMSMYVALLLKVDVSNERRSSQKVFEIILVSAHACMVLVVVIEAVATACAVFRQAREDAHPRINHYPRV